MVQSHIPAPLTESFEQEQTERKKAVKKAKRQRDKERKIADAPRKQEEAEKKRFLALSDREKVIQLQSIGSVLPKTQKLSFFIYKWHKLQ